MNWLHNWCVKLFRSHQQAGRTILSFRPRLEQLESREVMSAGSVTYSLQTNGNLLQVNSAGTSTLVDQNVKSFQVFTTPAGQTDLYDLHTDGSLWEVLPTGVPTEIRTQVASATAFGDGKGGTMLVILGQNGSLWLQQVETGWQFNVQSSGVSWVQGAADSTGTLNELYWLTSDGNLWQMDQSGARRVIDQNVQSVTLNAAGIPQVVFKLPAWAVINPANVQWQQNITNANGILVDVVWLTTAGALWQVGPSGVQTQIRSGVKSVQVFGDGKGGNMMVIVGLDTSLWLQQLQTGWQFNVQASGVSWAQGAADSTGTLSELYWLTSDGNLWQMDQSGARRVIDQHVQSVTLNVAGIPQVVFNLPAWAIINPTNVQWQQNITNANGILVEVVWLTTAGALWQVGPSGVQTQIRLGVKSVQVFGDGKGGNMMVIVGLDTSLWLQQLQSGWQFNVQASGVSWASGVANNTGVLTWLYWLTSDDTLWQMNQSGARVVYGRFVQAVTLNSSGVPQPSYDQIGQYWNALGNPSWLGVPTTGTLHTADGTGLYAQFSNGEIMWTPAGGAHAISGAVYARWLQANGTASALGAPLTDLQTIADGSGTQVQLFQNGALFLSKTGVVTATPSTSLYTQVTTLLSSLPDAGLRTLALDLELRDGLLTRSDVIALFREVEANGAVTANEYTSLQQLLTLATNLNIPGYVQDLAGKIINGDPANQHYQGSSLGNLGVGTSAANLDKLVDKWFYGTDLPNPTDDNGVNAYHYQLVSGTLFHPGNTVNYSDIVQGLVGDCYFLSALADMALNQPATVVGMFIDNHDALDAGDDTYTIRFFNPVKNAWTYETVNEWLPVNASGQFVFANFQESASNPSNVLWAALLEKAFAQANESGWEVSTPSNSYHGISFGLPFLAMDYLTGRTATHSVLTSAATVLADWTSKGDVSFNSTTATGYPNVIPYHAYSLVGYDPTTGLFTLYNPWGLAGGFEGSQFEPGLLTMTWTQITQAFNTWDGLAG
jgi:hypothetical protein